MNVKGTEVKVKRTRTDKFMVVRQNDGEYTQVRRTTKGSNLSYIKVQTLTHTLESETNGAKYIVVQMLRGSVEHCLEYLGDVLPSMKVERMTDGVRTEWSF